MTMKPLVKIALEVLRVLLTEHFLGYSTSMEILPLKGYTSLGHMIQRAC